MPSSLRPTSSATAIPTFYFPFPFFSLLDQLSMSLSHAAFTPPKAMLPPPEYRAPPPSPVAGPHAHVLDSVDEDDDEFAGFLSHSLPVPKLSLPHRIFPQEATPWDPPKIDFRRLISPEGKGPDAELLKSAAAAFGCFQLVNHGIPPGLVAAVGGAATSAFRIPPDAKKAAARTPERRCGFEVEEEGEGEEELLWLCPSAMRERKELAGIWPQTCTDFQEELEGLWRETKKIASRIEEVLLDDGDLSVESVIKSRREEEGAVDGSLLCFHKHASASKGGHSSGGFKHELLRMVVRSWSCSCCLSLHLLGGGASEFHIYSKRGWYKFWCPDDAAIIVTIGDQMQACGGGGGGGGGGGFYKHVIGKPVPVARKGGDSSDSISMAFHYAHQAASRPASQQEEGKTVSLAEQVMIVAFLAIAYRIVTSFYGGSI